MSSTPVSDGTDMSVLSSPPAIAGSSHKFHTLDALRGIAAITVLMYHFQRQFGTAIVPKAYLSVDLFFMLSGFVLTYAYQTRIDRGMRLSSFLQVRLVRLYPLYILATCIGFFPSLLHLMFGSHSVPNKGALFGSLALSLMFLPSPPSISTADKSLFPFDMAAWSLFFELIANVLHAGILKRRSWQFLSCATFLSGGLLVYFAAGHGTNFGAFFPEIPMALCRLVFSYLAGMMLFRFWETGRVRITLNPLLLLLILAAVLSCRVTSTSGAYDLLIICFVFPILLLLSANSVPSLKLVAPFEALGIVSYAIYVLHEPVGFLFGLTWKHFRHHTCELDAPWSGIVFLCVTISLAFVATRFYDVRVRGLLKRRLLG